MENIITTKRLLVTPMNENDIDFIVMLDTQYETYKYETDNAPAYDKITKNCNETIQRMQLLPDNGSIRWIVRKDDVMIGEIRLWCEYDKTHDWEIGYGFLKEYWGHGYASEAVRAVIQYGFEHFNINRIAAYLNAANNRSAALCERVGMVREGRLRENRMVNGIYYDTDCFSILKREYNSFKQKGKIIILNGVSSSGKSTLARTLQDKLPEAFFVIAGDPFMEMLGRPKYVDTSSEAYIQFYTATYHTTKAFSDIGMNTIIDGVWLKEDKIGLKELVELLHDYPVLFVHVTCPLEELRRREKERGDRDIGQGEGQLAELNPQDTYDITVDTSKDECVDMIIEALNYPEKFTAFKSLWQQCTN